MSQRNPNTDAPRPWRAIERRTVARCAVALALLAAVGSLTTPADAFKFVPFSQDFEPSGANASHTFFVDNHADKPIAVEVGVYRREMSRDGSDRLEDADDDFIVFPTQIVLPAGGRQAVRVQYIGASEIDAEQAYRIIAEQLPIDLGGEARAGVNIDFLLRYVGAIYVVPPGAAGDIEVDSAEVRDDGAEGRVLALTVTNGGNAHIILRDASVTLIDARGGELELSGDALGALQSGNVLAGVTRTFVIPVAPHVPTGAARIDLDFTSFR